LPHKTSRLPQDMAGRGLIGRVVTGPGKGAPGAPDAGPTAGKPAAGQSPAAGALKTGGSPGGKPVSTKDITSFLALLKLPGDEFSASVLSFAKFFSLPLDGPFLGKIRQKALAGQGGSPPGRGRDSPPAPGSQFREALALAAIASSAKGFELSPQALAAYARSLLHGSPPEDGEAEAPAKEAEVPAGREAEGSAVAERPGERGSGEHKAPEKETPDGPRIRKLALAAQDPLLETLNGAPGKDGSRWIVLPFSLEGLDICLRILLAGSRACLMGLDIRDGEGAWRFIAHPDVPGGGDDGEAPPWSLEVSRSPAPAKGRAKALERGLAEFLGLPREKIRVHGEELPVFAESRDWTLPSVNKEV
jgi:hypothetical protein